MATINIANLTFTHKGDYDGSTAYAKNDVVYYATNGNAYIAKQATTGNAPTNGTYWSQFAAGSGGIWNAGLSLGSAGQAVKVNAAGNALEFGAVAGGKIGQVIQTVKTDAFSTSSGINGSNWVAVTGLSAQITPSATTSKVLVMPSYSLSGSNRSYSALFIGGSMSAFIGDAIGSATRQTSGYYQASNHDTQMTSYNYLHSPNSTSQQTYQIYICNNGNDGASVSYINRHNSSSGSSASDETSASSFTLMEVLA